MSRRRRPAGGRAKTLLEHPVTKKGTLLRHQAVAAVGVILSLIYLAIQIRQNTQPPRLGIAVGITYKKGRVPPNPPLGS